MPLRQEVKDWAAIGGLCISIFSLAVSASIAYVSVFRQYDDVRVALGMGPWFKHDTKWDTLFVDNKASLTLINAGTRPAAVTHVLMGLTETKRKTSSEICQKRGPENALVYKLEPFVIKSGEIVTKDITLGDSDGGLSLRHSKVGNSDPYYVSVCMTFMLVTPDSNESVAHVPVGILQVNKTGSPASYVVRPRDYAKPVALLPGDSIKYAPSSWGDARK